MNVTQVHQSDRMQLQTRWHSNTAAQSYIAVLCVVAVCYYNNLLKYCLPRFFIQLVFEKEETRGSLQIGMVFSNMVQDRDSSHSVCSKIMCELDVCNNMLIYLQWLLGSLCSYFVTFEPKLWSRGTESLYKKTTDNAKEIQSLIRKHIFLKRRRL